MRDDIISYREMCDKERVQTLQRGMSFRLNPKYSVILMSQRKNAPYRDKVLNDGTTLEYEGHDAPKTSALVRPKEVDQIRYLDTGKLIQNGYFVEAVISTTTYRFLRAEPVLPRTMSESCAQGIIFKSRIR